MQPACVRWLRALVLAGAFLGTWIPFSVPAQVPAASAPASAGQHRPLPSDLPLKREGSGTAGEASWTPLLVVLGLAAASGAAVVLRRRGPAGRLRSWERTRPGAGIGRVVSQPLTAHASVHAVHWQNEELLLGCTSTQVTVLARRPAVDSTAWGAG